MKKTFSARAYFIRAKVFVYLMALSGLLYFFWEVFNFINIE